MRFTVAGAGAGAALALFCVLASANAGLARGGGPPRSTGPTFPRGGFRFRREVDVEEPMQEQDDPALNVEVDLPEDSIRDNMEIEVQQIPVIETWYRLPRGVQVIEIEEEQY